MFSLFKNKPTTEMKGYKITDNERSHKYGIGANSLKMLKEKAVSRFPIKNFRLYSAKDGVEISDEDYFQTLPPQTLLIIAGSETDITIDADFEYKKLKERIPLLQVSDIMTDFMEQHPEEFRKMLIQYERNMDLKPMRDKTISSLKEDHLEWFQDSSTERCSTKEEVMMKRAQDRIRGYYYKTKEEITKSKLYRTNLKSKEIFDNILKKFRYLLIACNYFSMLFDRTCSKRHESLHMVDETDALLVNGPLPSKRVRQTIKEFSNRRKLLDEWMLTLCTEFGDFYCQGPYSESSLLCTKNHKINPYSSRENLILFQVWNLDHQIELTRSVLPSLIKNVKDLTENPSNVKCLKHKQLAVDVSVLEYFLEIFSLKNLRLVHIVCHEKGQRLDSKSKGKFVCKSCNEYKLLKDLIDEISSIDEVDAWLEE